nr:RsmB/NOP family class I SAM-dependent RNA methyltransferase [Paenibacillus oenotherae]
MRLTLPQTFIDNMQAILGSQTDSFLNSYNEPRTYGLRLNPLKAAALDKILPALTEQFGLQPIPWCATGYYYNEEFRPGKHPYHAAGLYYIQEPSAMTAAELLDPQPGEVILDLAAAPGGKTTQIAGKMHGQGVLVANEIHPARAKILSENVERCGIVNAIVTSAAPDELSRRFPALFDRIMLDAPCSGEGMFRKDEGAIAEWSDSHVAMCAARQSDILEHAAIMLKPGGRLVYSTCTFNRSENEDTIHAFCLAHPEFEVSQIERVWPHESRGEGHFVAVLHKAKPSDVVADACSSHASAAEDGPAERISSSAQTVTAPKLRAREARSNSSRDRGADRGRRSSSGGAGGSSAADMALLHAFCAAALPGGAGLGPGEPLRFGDALYWLPHTNSGSPIRASDLQGLKVARPGLHLGDIRTNRIEPSHSLALAVSAHAAAWVQSYRPDAPEIAAFLRGETLPAQEGSSGWGLIAVDDLPLGWGKASGGQIKNHLPKGLRWFK